MREGIREDDRSVHVILVDAKQVCSIYCSDIPWTIARCSQLQQTASYQHERGCEFEALFNKAYLPEIALIAAKLDMAFSQSL